MDVLDRSVDSLILRPLVGLNKSDILKLSREINTYEISAIPHDDACSLLSPKNPIIKPDKNYWRNFKIDEMDQQLISAVDESEKYELFLDGNFRIVND